MAVIAVLTNLPDSESAFNLARELVQPADWPPARTFWRPRPPSTAGRARDEQATEYPVLIKSTARALRRARGGDPRAPSLLAARDHRLADRARAARIPRLGRAAKLARRERRAGSSPRVGRRSRWLAGRRALAGSRVAGRRGPPRPGRRRDRPGRALRRALSPTRRARPQSLGQFQGKVAGRQLLGDLVRALPRGDAGFDRLQERWAERGVQFVGLSDEDPREGRPLRPRARRSTIRSGPAATRCGELSRRLGNRLGVLPHTVILDPRGEVLEQRVGPYTEAELERRLAAFAPKMPLTSPNRR